VWIGAEILFAFNWHFVYFSMLLLAPILNFLTKYIFAACCLLLAASSYTQNLVPNGSFEDTTNCSLGTEIYRTSPWQEPTGGTSDWFNPCTSKPSGSDVPQNDFGWQNAQGGASYAGFILYVNGLYYREYIQAQLLDTLVAGTKYWVSFHVNLADSSEYAIKEIGAYFSDTAVYSSDIIPLPYTPQVKSGNTFLDDKINWTLISGTFIATGGEQFITLGNFQDSTTIDTLNVGGSGIGEWTSYYYIDNICISNDSTTCDISTSILSNNLVEPISIYPNPAKDFVNIQNSFNAPFDMAVYNSIGQQLYSEQNITSNHLQLNISNYSSGLLFITITSNNNQFIYKLLKH
jgi:hypothetical protein